eukprot:TRINITY_DN50858_c0_g1_i1.p3 TRINITY_DN50858_c0_g1~~TRINITY_DN50858_c0_g1_i1.p3  ORF type:complete len:119 (+),score=20.54 TRINITY_DN50858_c0_g1_i1:462-818(+)
MSQCAFCKDTDAITNTQCVRCDKPVCRACTHWLGNGICACDECTDCVDWVKTTHDEYHWQEIGKRFFQNLEIGLLPKQALCLHSSGMAMQTQRMGRRPWQQHAGSSMEDQWLRGTVVK